MVPPPETSPSRRMHISRLPSSALLGSGIRETLATQVRLISIRLAEGVGSEFIQKWNELALTAASDKRISWDVYQSGLDIKIFANQLITNNNKPYDEMYTVSPERQRSGLLNHISSLESTLGRWLGALRNFMERPCESSQCAILLQEDSISSIFLLETIQIKPGKDREFIDTCFQWMTDYSRPDRKNSDTPTMSRLREGVHEETGVSFMYTVLQDLNDLEEFKIGYYFQSSTDIELARQSETWINWRLLLDPIMRIAPKVERFRRISKSSSTAASESSEGVDYASPSSSSSSSSYKSPNLEQFHHFLPTEENHDSDALEKICLESVRLDGKLGPHADLIKARYLNFVKRQENILDTYGSIYDFAGAANYFGLHELGGGHSSKKYVIRQILPEEAASVSIVGDFNDWDPKNHQLVKDEHKKYQWSLEFTPEKALQFYRLIVVYRNGRTVDSSCPWSRKVKVAEDCSSADSTVCSSSNSRPRKHGHEFSNFVRAYEVHIGISTKSESGFGTYDDVRVNVLPRLPILGFNTLILVGIQEHLHYASLGWHVTSFFAASTRFGEPEELKRLVDDAHALNIRVVMSLIVTHPSPVGGIKDFFDSQKPIFNSSQNSTMLNFDTVRFNYADNDFVARLILSMIRYFAEEFEFDGFRLESLNSLMYEKDWLELHDYGDSFRAMSMDGVVLLMLITSFVDSLGLISIGNGGIFPGCGLPILSGGTGLDFVVTNAIPSAVRRFLHNGSSLGVLRQALDSKCVHERRIATMETLDNIVVSKRRLRVAMYAWETLHTIAVGGIAPHVTELAAALRRNGHEIHIFTRSTGVTGNLSKHYGVYYHEVAFNLCRDFVQECQSMCSAFYDAMDQYETSNGFKFDIIHGHDWLTARGVLRAQAEGRVCVLTMHSTEIGRCGNQVYEGDSGRIRAIESWCCHQLDRIITVSGVLAQEITKHYDVDPAKIRVVYNGINTTNFDGFEDAGPIKARLDMNPLDPTFLFVGRFVIQKGVDLLIEAIPEILQFNPNTKFVIVGDGHMRCDVEDRARTLGVHHNCRFVGAKSGNELKSLFKMCDGVIVPSRNEPFGIVVLEAWAAYKPVIATTCGGPRDFVNHDVDGYLVDPNPRSITWGCCELLKNFEHARWMGERGRVKAAFSFSWDTVGVQTRDIYYELLNKSDAPYGLQDRGDSSLAQSLMGQALLTNMGIFDPSDFVKQNFGRLRCCEVLVRLFGGEASMVAMGSEFAHPDWVDLPRAGNKFSNFYAGRQWKLSTNKSLKYKEYQLFIAALHAVEINLAITEHKDSYVVKYNEDDKVLAFERGHCIVVVNFHSYRSYVGFPIGTIIDSAKGFRCLLDSDETRFGGYGRLDDSPHNTFPIVEEPQDGRNKSIKVYLPSMSCLVLATAEILDEKGTTHPYLMSEFLPDDLIDKIIEVTQPDSHQLIKSTCFINN